LSPAQIAAADWVDSRRRDRLNAAREVAQKWVATLTTSASLLGAGALFNADATVRTLEQGWKVAFAIATTMAALLAVCAILAASFAASPRLSNLPVDVDAQVELYESSVVRVSMLLRASRVAAVLAVLFLALTFGIRWFAPVAAASS
jgi:hypothetical protein